MAKMIVINPASGDTVANIFSGKNASSPVLEQVKTGTIIKVISSVGDYYQVACNNTLPNIINGGTLDTGTLIAYPYAPMYKSKNKNSLLANVNNGSKIRILDPSDPNYVKIVAYTTQGDLEGYVEAKFVYRDYESELDLEKDDTQLLTLKTPYSDNIRTNQTGTTINTNLPLNCRSGPGTSYGIIGTLPPSTAVVVTEVKSGWTKISSPVTGWVSSSYVKITGTEVTGNVSKSDATEIPSSSTGSDDDTESSFTSEEWEAAFNQFEDTQGEFNATDDYYNMLSNRTAFALGAPPKYNMDIDIQYGTTTNGNFGRVYSKTFLSSPSILSLCPGKVTMFPNLIGSQRDGIYEAMVELAGGSAGGQSLLSKIKEDEGGIFSGKLYKFEAKTADYAKDLNALCRSMAIMLGIGEKQLPYTNAKLRDFDYAYWTIRKKYNPYAANSSDTDKSIFRNFWPDLVKEGTRLVSNAVDDTTYINFFLNGSETTVTESIGTGVVDSPLESLLGPISEAGSVLNYFTGSGFDVGGADATEAIKAVFEDSGSTLDGLVNLGKNFLSGGRMILPKMLQEATYGRSIACSMKFVSPYGDPYSVFMNCIVPVAHLLAMSLPRQLSDNMYTYPYILRGAQLGSFNLDIGVITNLSIDRGGSDDTCWSIDNLSTEWNVQVELTPLVDELMITGTNHPALFMKNEMLLDYLANYCGFDILANQMSTKLELIATFMNNYVLDIPHALEHRINDELYTKLNSAFGFIF